MEYYMKLYEKEVCLPCDSSTWSFPTVSHRNRRWLNRPVSPHQMGVLKAPGPDGFSPGLFQLYWHVVGDKVTEAIRRMFWKGKLDA